MNEKYQGKEINVTIQAPTEGKLNEMVSGVEKYAKRFDMGEVRILERGMDPDGGYRAIITAHNFNPFKWLKRRKDIKSFKTEEGKENAKRFYRRLDAVQEAEKKRKKAKKAEEKAEREERKKEKLRIKAEQEEQKARIAVAKAQQKLAKKGRLTPVRSTSRRRARLPR